MYRRIIVHGSKCHADDYLSACIALAEWPTATVERKTPTREDMCDMLALVLDVGMVNDGQNHLDHHVSRDLPCSFHLLMQKMGLHIDALAILPGYEFMNVIDTRGPLEACAFAGMPMSALGKSEPLVQSMLLSVFEGMTVIEPGHFMHEIMRRIGLEMMFTIRCTLENYERLMREARMVYVGGYVFLNCNGSMDGVEYYLKRTGLSVHGFITYDQRGAGWAVMRDKALDSTAFDFKALKGDSRAEFVHANGFFFSTKNRVPIEALKEMIALGMPSKTF